MKLAGMLMAIVAVWSGLTLLLPVWAKTPDEIVRIIVKDHQFFPSEVRVPAGRRLQLQILNKDRTLEEFESHVLNLEKMLPAKERTLLFVNPLAPGRYEFIGELHPQTAQGVIVAE